MDTDPHVFEDHRTPAGIEAPRGDEGTEAGIDTREATAQIPDMGESAVSDTEADEMEEHLRGLGYIE